ncbi:hypothetical protein HK102_013674 [Quaeritorhiza haematococci]|nr:hypothetical protein HK102_013674 [Quaeritorhiza haematococci]
MPTDEQLDRFLDWLRKEGASVGSLSLRQSRSVALTPESAGSSSSSSADTPAVTQDAGIGVFATEPLHMTDDQSVADVPSKFFLTATKVKSLAKQAPKLSACLKALETDTAYGLDERKTLVVFLLYAKHCFRDDADTSVASEDHPSFWKPYFDVLPQSVDTPLFWRTHEKMMLAGTGLENSIGGKLSKLKAEYSAALRHLSATLEPTGTPPPGSVVTFESYVWADAVFWSRVISFASQKEGGGSIGVAPSPLKPNLPDEEDDYHLIPFVDFCNHRFSPQLRWQRTPESQKIQLRAVSGAMVTPGTELFISYGAKSNLELLFLHGFVVENNPYDTAFFPVPFVEAQQQDGESGAKAAKIVQLKSQFLRSLGLRGMVELRMPKEVRQDQSEADAWDVQKMGDDATGGILTTQAMLSMWCAVLTAEDGLELTEVETEAGTAKATTKVHCVLAGTPVDDQESFAAAVRKLPLFEVIQLRVWTILISMAQFRMHQLSQESSGESTRGKTSTSSSHGEESPSAKARMSAVEIVRGGLYRVLDAALSMIESLQAEYSTRPAVKDYLDKMQRGE